MKKIIDRLLSERNITGNFGLTSFAPLSSWTDLGKAARRIAAAIARGETMAVWGDYDADGVTGAAIFLQFVSKTHRLNNIPASGPFWHIPDRFREGYGINADGVRELGKAGVSLLVTADWGISACKALAEASRFGMDVVVTDHHLPGGTLPFACAICDPHARNMNEPDISGCGMIYAVLMGAAQALAGMGKKIPDMRQWLDLAALGTIADVASMTGQNRILAKNGLMSLSMGKRPAMAALKRVSGLGVSSPVTAECVGFALGPRLNAAGRMEHAKTALELLMSEDENEAFEIAQKLDVLNRQRKEKEEAIVREACGQAESLLAKGMKGLVLYGKNWHGGVIGIAASRIADKFGMPALVACGSGKCKSSGRSGAGISLKSALEKCRSLLSFGGHDMAAGASFMEEDIEKLRQEFSKACASLPRIMPERQADAEWDCMNFGEREMAETVRLEPCGRDNPPVLFASGKMWLAGFSFRGGLLNASFRNSKGVARTRSWQPGRVFSENDLGKAFQILWTPKRSSLDGSIEFEAEKFVEC